MMKKEVKNLLKNLMLVITVLALLVQMTPIVVVAATDSADSTAEELQETVEAQEASEIEAESDPPASTGKDDEPAFPASTEGEDAPESPLSTAESEGSFLFVAIANSDVIAKPVQVNYVIGDTISSALTKTDYVFEGLDIGTVSSVNGVEGVYGRSVSNQDEIDLQRLDITPEPLADNLLVFQADYETFTVSENYLLLVSELLRYEGSEEARNYTASTNLYLGITRELATLLTDAERSLELYQNLSAAIDAAEQQDEGAKFTVAVELKHGGENLHSDQASVNFTNNYGWKRTASAGETIELLPGEYSFLASIPGLNKKARGEFTVETRENGEAEEPETQVFVLDFPGDDYWFTGVSFGLSYGASSVTYDPVTDLDFDFALMDNSTSTTLYAGQTWSEEASKFDNLYRKAAITYLPTNSSDMREVQISNSSTSSRPTSTMTYFIPSGGLSRTVPYLVTLTDVDNDLVYTQEYTLNLQRPRTLADLQVSGEEGAVHLEPAFTATTYEYTAKILDTNTSVDVSSTPFASYEQGYRVYVNDELAPEGGSVTVALNTDEEIQDPIKVQVRHIDGTISEEYTISPELLPAVSVDIKIPITATLEVTNSVGTAADFSNLKKEKDYHTYTFNLPEGLSHKYVLTEDTYYTTSGTFIAETDGEISATVDTNDYIESIKIRQNASSDYYLDLAGSDIAHEIHATLPDYYSASRMTVGLTEAAGGRTILAKYLQQTISVNSNNQARTITLKDRTETTLTSFITAGGRGQEIELVVQQVDGEFTRQQTYHITLDRELHLRNSPPPSFTYSGLKAVYNPTFDRDQFDAYEVVVSETASELLVALGQNGTIRSEIEEPYTILINGIVAEPAANYESNSPMLEALIPLNGTNVDEEILVELSNSYGASGEYKFAVKKLATVNVSFSYEPEDAVLTLYDEAGSRIWPEDDGSYKLLKGANYKYVLSKADYVALSAIFVADPEVTHIDLILEEAVPNENIDPTLDVEWNKFRGDNNTGVTSRETPTSAEDAQLFWAYMSSGMSHVGQPIVLDDYVAIMTGNKLQYLDLLSGELLAEGIMFSGGGLVPVYSDGMIFTPVTNGLQAFNASPRPQTADDVGYSNSEVMVLDSLWTYNDPIGGAGLSPFYVENGYIYGGWQQTRNEGAFVCLSITDEDPTQSHEEKEATWRWIRNRGFYWAGAHVGEKFVVVGGEQSGDDDLTCLDVTTGKVLDTIPNLFTLENRGSVSYDIETDRYCLATKDTFYSVRVDGNGKFYDLAQGSIGGASTSTPAIFNGRAYMGVSGNGQFQSFTGAGVVVIDIATAQPVYAMNTRGYPQSSGLISAAYLDVPHHNPQTGEEETGFAYVYFTENINPGNISYIIDKPGITEPVIFDTLGGIKTASLLFQPKGHHAQYNLSSLQVDKYGTLYMKTDRGYIMAIGQRIDELELRQKPERTVYYPGEIIDLTGIEVIAKYNNGFERDVSAYVTVSEELLLAGQTSIEISFPYALYNNYTPNDYIDSNPSSSFDKLPRPSVSVPINVLNDEEIRSVDDLESLINAIGTVDFTSESLSKIRLARIAYDGSDPVLRPAIRNYQMLLDAEERYELLEQAAKNLLPASEVVTDQNRIVLNVEGPLALHTEDENILKAFTLTLEELKAVENGATITITVEATVLDRIPPTEELFAESGLQQFKLKSTGYVLDIKLKKEIESCQPLYLSSLYGNEKIKLELPLPEEHYETGRSFYMLNIHGGGTYSLKNQADADSNKVVIETGRFSTYILAYAWLDTTPDKETPTPSPSKPQDEEEKDNDNETKPLPAQPDGPDRLPSDSDDLSSDTEDLAATGDGGNRLPVTEQDKDKDPVLLAPEDEGTEAGGEDPETVEVVPGEEELDEADSEGEQQSEEQQVIAEGEEEPEQAVRSFERAGENLGLILLLSVMGLSIIGGVAIFLIKKKKRDDATPDQESE